MSQILKMLNVNKNPINSVQSNQKANLWSEVGAYVTAYPDLDFWFVSSKHQVALNIVLPSVVNVNL